MKLITTLILLLLSLTAHSAPRLYVFRSDAAGFHTNTVFYDDGQQVVAFDAQFTEKQATLALQFLRSKTRSRLTHLVITHPNPDKFNGLTVFQKAGAKVIASRATATAMLAVHRYKRYYFVSMAKMFRANEYPTLGKADIVFSTRYELKLNSGKRLLLLELGRPGVSSNQTVALIAPLKAVVVGDLIHPGTHAWLEGGIVNGKAQPNLASWRGTLDRLARLIANPQGWRVYAGRGKPMELVRAVAAQKRYLQTAERVVKAYIAGLPNASQLLRSKQAGQHYLAIEQRLVKRFPRYQLSYLVRYGVYGLVNTLLNQAYRRAQPAAP